MKRVSSLLLALLLLLAVPFSAFATTYEKMEVTAEKTPIYEKATVKSEKLSTAKEGFIFTPVGDTKSFWKIEFKKKNDDTLYTGYILKEAADFVAEQPAAKVVEEKPKEEKTTVYWVPNGKSYHYTDKCATLKRSKDIRSGTIAESKKSDPCNVCADGAKK